MFQLTKAFTRRAESQNKRRQVRRGIKSRKCPGRFAVLAWTLILSVTSLTLPGAARAQVLYGSLMGNVNDSAGAAVPGATVTAFNNATNVSKETTTNGEGIYQFSDLLPGVYKVTVSGTGFSTSVSEGVN